MKTKSEFVNEKIAGLNCEIHKQGPPIVDIKDDAVRVFGCCPEYSEKSLPAVKAAIQEYDSTY